MKHSKIKKLEKKSYVIMSLVICLCFITIGYAILTQNLNIDGTSKVTGVWDIEFTNITSTKKGGALNKETPTYTKTTATFNTTLNEPGDKMTYTITVKNSGNIDAIVESITLSDSTNNDINYTYQGIAVGNVLEATKSQKFLVIVEYDKNVTTVTKASESATLTINYVQKFNSNITETEVPVPSITISELRDLALVTTGDGLYADDTEPGRYIFKGASPANNITFNGENWQILSIEADGTMKIVKETTIGSSKQWDAANTRNSTDDTYCTSASSLGCNAWAKTANLLDTTGHAPTEYKLYYPNGNISNDTTTYAGSVTTTDASLNTYLNVDYFTNTLKTDKQYIVEHKFNIGTPGCYTDTESVAVNVEQEKNYQWIGKVGLITATEYMRTTTNTTCTSLSAGYGSSNASICGTNNWLKKSSEYWTISPFVSSDRHGVWYVNSSGYLTYSSAYGINGVAPAVYLDSDILLSGSGTTGSRYQITGRM